MGQPVRLPGLLSSCVAILRCLLTSQPYRNTVPLLTPLSSISGTLWSDPSQLLPAAQPTISEMFNLRSELRRSSL